MATGGGKKSTSKASKPAAKPAATKKFMAAIVAYLLQKQLLIFHKP
jgi:hypothetical protein